MQTRWDYGRTGSRSEAMRRYAKKEKPTQASRKQISGNQGSPVYANCDRIKNKLEDMRMDLIAGKLGGDQESKEQKGRGAGTW